MGSSSTHWQKIIWDALVLNCIFCPLCGWVSLQQLWLQQEVCGLACGAAITLPWCHHHPLAISATSK